MWQKLHDCVRDDYNFLENIITGNESRIFVYDPEKSAKASNGTHPSQIVPKSLDERVESEVHVDCRCFRLQKKWFIMSFYRLSNLWLPYFTWQFLKYYENSSAQQSSISGCSTMTTHLTTVVSLSWTTWLNTVFQRFPATLLPRCRSFRLHSLSPTQTSYSTMARFRPFIRLWREN